MKHTLAGFSMRGIYGVLQTARSVVSRHRGVRRREQPIDEGRAGRIKALIVQDPTYRYRLLWAMLRTEGRKGNPKRAIRILKAKRWPVHQRVATPRPRAQRRRRVAQASNLRWAMDRTHITCGRDGLAHLNGLIERFFRAPKEGCVWQHQFRSFADARREIARWIDWYSSGRPHQSLGHVCPREYREKSV